MPDRAPSAAPPARPIQAGGAEASVESIDDCDLVYGDYPGDCAIFDLLDVDNDCSHPGGHQWAKFGDDAICVHCSKPGMPVKASREAE